MSENQKLSPVKFGLLGFQHMFAMFGATVLVPILTGLNPSATLLFAGLGTLLFHLITGGRVPAFLGSSFAFLGGYFAVSSMPEFAQKGLNWIPYAGAGVAAAGLIYVAVSALFKVFGAKKVMRFFPPVVTGPIIIAIGLILSNSAINNCATNWPIAILALAIVVVFNIWGKGMLKVIPILLGVVGSYVVAAIFGQLDPKKVELLASAKWIGSPFALEETVFSFFTNGVDGGLLLTCIITIAPIALATMMEHIGDISAISSTVGENFIEKPGLHRTLLGDGLATTMAALFGAPANTTYGENTGVLALTKVYNPAVVRMAAVLAIVFSFCPKFAALIQCMPAATIGGVSLILYGMISAIGVRNIVENQVDFSKSRNVIIAALIIALALGINFSNSLGATIHPEMTVDITKIVNAEVAEALGQTEEEATAAAEEHKITTTVATTQPETTVDITETVNTEVAEAPGQTEEEATAASAAEERKITTTVAGTSNAGAIKFNIGDVQISLSGLAVASLVGILVNAILPGKDYEFGKKKEGDEAVNFQV